MKRIFSTENAVKKVFFHLLPLVLALITPPAMAAPQAGTLIETEGTVFIIKNDGKKRIVASGSAIDQGDSIRTEKDSSAKIRYSDGSQMAIRPNTTLSIQNYSFEENKPEKDSFVMNLVRGGLRQITGLIGKRGNQEAYQLRGSTSTIGIRGTDFTARVCEDQTCQLTGESKKLTVKNSELLIAKAIEVRGKVSVLQIDGLRRDINVGSNIYQNDLIETSSNSYAAILFKDETRVVLPTNSSLRLSNYRYLEKEPEKSQVFFDLVKGAFRMATGLIGKVAPKNVNVGVSTATIGVRGTVFDLACVPDDITMPETYVGEGTLCGRGLITSTRDGAISITTENGITNIFSTGQSTYLHGPNQTPIVLNLTPKFFDSLPGPLPEKIIPDIPGTFGIDGTNIAEAGLFVTVTEGRVLISQTGNVLLLGAGESGFASGTSSLLQRLNTPPLFLNVDQQSTQKSLGFNTCRM